MFIFFGMAFVLPILEPHLLFRVVFYLISLAAMLRLLTVSNYLVNLEKNSSNLHLWHQLEKYYTNYCFAVWNVGCYVKTAINLNNMCIFNISDGCLSTRLIS